ncbi:MAG: ornithine carbamoyltransferase [Candidatus Altiarchaeota archaeon]
MSLISIRDLSRDDVSGILDLAAEVKKNPGEYSDRLSGRKLAMIFEKPSTRTRVSFEVAMIELGGTPIVLNAGDMQLGRGETIADTARVMTGYVDCVMARVFKHSTLEELRKYSKIPVINGLSEKEHPCQVIGDLLTIRELKGDLKGLNLAFVGDGNNVCNSLILGCSLTDVNITVATPPEYKPAKGFVNDALKTAVDSKVIVLDNPESAVKGADVVYTDVWVSMGDESQEGDRLTAFEGFQVNRKLMSHAKENAIFMHCLPAHRGVEVTDDVIDSRQSVVWRQAENRVHAQKAILLKQFGLE